MALNTLLAQVKDAVLQHTQQQNGQSAPFDPTQLLTTVEGLFAQHQASQSQSQSSQSQPQGMDPFGGLPNEIGDLLKGQDPHSIPSD